MATRRELPFDLRLAEARRARGGWRLRCPRCARWSEMLLVVGRWQLACARCRAAPTGTDTAH